MPDGGPIYAETAEAGFLAEPFNALSELAFLAVVLVWAWRLRGRWREHRFVAACLPLIFVAFLGGFLFHGLRTQRAFLMLDVLPIVVLLVASVGYLAGRVTGRAWIALVYVALFVGGCAALVVLLPRGFRRYALIYVFAAATMAVPVFVDAARRRWQGLRLLLIAVGAVLVGSLFHVFDREFARAVPMGTHWLWHVLAAVAVHHLIAYLVATGRRPSPA